MGSLAAKLKLSARELAIIIGTILGDAHVEQYDNDARISVLHSLKQKELVNWKHRELKRFVRMQPKIIRSFDSRYAQTYFQFRFQTRRYPAFKALAKIFYQKRTKIIPKSIGKLLIEPISLAVWYMDDGGRRKDCHGMFLNTLSFSETEQKILQKCLLQNFDIKSRIHWVTDGFRLYIPQSDALKFCQIIGPHIIPSMTYKLPYDPLTTESAGLWRRR